MRAFFLLLGFGLGLWLAFRWSVWPLAAVAAFYLLSLWISSKRGQIATFFIASLFGVAIGSIKYAAPDGIGDYQGMVIETKSDYFLYFSRLTRYYVYEQGHLREPGDVLLIKGRSLDFTKTTYESRFDFGEYLESKGVRKELKAYRISVSILNPLRLREREKEWLGNFDPSSQALLDSVLFNRKNYQSSSISMASSLNLLSLFSASGILFSLLLRSLERILLLIMSKKTVRWIVLAAATLLLPLGFPKIGILRVYASLIFRLLNETIWKKRFEHLEILSFSGMSLLVIERHLIYQTGFLFGFGLSFIMLFSRGLIERKGKRLKPFFVAVLIQGFLLPISLSEGGFHVFQVFFNAVSIPFSSIFGLIGLFSFITWPLPSLINGMAIFLETFFSFLRSIDVYVSLPPLSGWFCLVYYIALGFGLYCEEIGMNPYRNKVYGIVFSLYLIGLIPAVPSLSQEVSFINVGQGDSIMIRDGFTTVLIDTGGNIGFDMATESLIPYFLKKRIYKIDCLIASHGDYDHIGAKESLMENFRIGRFVQGPESFPLQIGGLLFTNFNTYEESGENEKSLVLSLDFMDRKWLFTGDAPIEIEEKIIRDWPDLDCDVLKLGHHGSDTSSSLSFLQTVSPKEAVISVGAKNRYGHPSASVLKRLASLGIKVRRTDVEGTITYRKAKPFWL